MADIPYMPFYINDFEGDTAHLTLEEDGAYNRLLRLCWRTSGCSVPNDSEWIRRKMRATDQQYDDVIAPIIKEFFKIDKGRVFQERLQKEFSRISEQVYARKAAGKKGGNAKALKNNKNTSSKATVLPLAKAKQSPSIQSQSHIQSQKDIESASVENSNNLYTKNHLLQLTERTKIKNFSKKDLEIIAKWEAEGLDFDMVIIPTIIKVFEKQQLAGDVPHSLVYYDNALGYDKANEVSKPPPLPTTKKGWAKLLAKLKFDVKTEKWESAYWRDHYKYNKFIFWMELPPEYRTALNKSWGKAA